MGGLRNGREAEEKEELNEAEHWGERASTRQSCRESGTVSQARLKYKWKFSLRRIDAILVNEKREAEGVKENNAARAAHPVPSQAPSVALSHPTSGGCRAEG